MWRLYAGLALAGGWPDVSEGWSASQAGAKDAALVIAIEDYDKVADVAGARQTGQDWETFFARHRGVPLSRVQLLSDDFATREAILKKAETVAAEVKPGGTLWVVYVGHGAPSRDGEDGLLVGVDARQNPDSLYERSVTRSELEGVLRTGRQSETVLVVDACFSGRRDGSGALLVEDMQPTLATSLAASAGVTLLSAGRSDEFAGPLPGLSRPGFSYLLLGALRGWGDSDGNGTVTTAEAVEYARGGLSRLQGRTQTPELLGTGELAMARATEQGPDLLALFRAAGPTGPSGGEVSRDGGFGEVSLNVSAKLADQACDEAAKRDAAAWVDNRLDEAATSLVREAEGAWDRLEPEATACLGLEMAQRGECISAVEGWLKRASGAKVSVGAGVHQASTDCGAREAAFAAAQRAVAISSVSAARSLLSDLRVEGPRPGEVWTSPTGVELVLVPGGTFTMGSPASEPDRDNDETEHRVTVDDLLVMRTEVTQALWQQVMGSNQGACDSYKGVSLVHGAYPVMCISWSDAVSFANALSKREGLRPAYRVSGDDVTWDRGADGYRLLTEAEWEHAARGGTPGQVFAGAEGYRDVCEVGNVADLDGRGKFGWTTHDPQCSDGNVALAGVGSYRANGYGLSDMTGNVWEWVWDWFGDYPSGSQSNPSGAQDGSSRVFRGGSWRSFPAFARVAIRFRIAPGYRAYFLGVRLARPAP
jgi:formylglycine-generating enzyme required for sulfatase activity